MSLTRDLTLEDISSAFANWRRTKTKSGERIPHELWQQVKKISGNYSRAQITQTLRINTEQYRRYVHADSQPTADEASIAKAPIASNAFVKVENPLSIQASAMLRLEFIRKDGAILNCYYPNIETLHQTVQWFVG